MLSGQSWLPAPKLHPIWKTLRPCLCGVFFFWPAPSKKPKPFHQWTEIVFCRDGAADLAPPVLVWTRVLGRHAVCYHRTIIRRGTGVDETFRRSLAVYTLHTLHSTLYTFHSTLHTPHSTLYAPHFQLALLTPHSTLYTPHSTLYTPHSTLYTPHSTLYTLHSTLHALHFTLHTPHSTLYTLHSTLYTLYTPHSTLYTPHSLPYTPHSTLYTFHSTLHTLHFPLHTADWQQGKNVQDCSKKLLQKSVLRDCISMCFDICAINIRVSIRVRGLHLVLFFTNIFDGERPMNSPMFGAEIS